MKSSRDVLLCEYCCSVIQRSTRGRKLSLVSQTRYLLLDAIIVVTVSLDELRFNDSVVCFLLRSSGVLLLNCTRTTILR